MSQDGGSRDDGSKSEVSNGANGHLQVVPKVNVGAARGNGANDPSQRLDVFQETQCENISIQLTANANCDRRRWNLPTADEVAVVIPGDPVVGTTGGGSPGNRCTSLGRPLRRISDRSPECTSSSNIPTSLFVAKTGITTTLKCPITLPIIFNAVGDVFSLLLQSGRLFQWHFVDVWAAADQNRLSYLCHHQKDI